MTDSEKLRWTVENWNEATEEQRAEAQMIAAVEAANAYTDQMVNRALGLTYDWATGEWK